MKFVLASRNPKKIAELRTLLSAHLKDAEVLSLDDVGILGEIEENGATFEENALIKARVAATSGYIGLGDDSGLCVDALNGEPGIYSARYAARTSALTDHSDEENNRVLLEKLNGLSPEERTASFVCCFACVYPDGREFTVRGEAKGRILSAYCGDGGFGYDPLFFYEPLNKTFAQLTPAEKNRISHRARALEAFAKTLLHKEGLA
ncbi:MAG: RdgB/HAM1 family non-canonical purine NTP pyrophosphatase [Clostridia bacterium]|nr:RdgB/HAM1 family non-canonical purine NTP pyrophosphatase [Clostridia bacterium]